MKQPPGARRPHHAAAAVEHDAAVHADAEVLEQFLEHGGFRQGELKSAGRVGRVARQVEKLGTRNVPAIKGYPTQFALHAGPFGLQVGGGLEDAQIGVSERAFEIVGRDQVVVQNRFHRHVTPRTAVHPTSIAISRWEPIPAGGEFLHSASRPVGVTPTTVSRSPW